MDTLKKNEVKATFFMTGGWIENYPEDVKAIAADGHELGNHSENHKEMSKLSNILNHKNLGNGSIILCHNDGEHTAESGVATQ